MSENSETTLETFFKTFSGSTSFDKDLDEFRERVSTYIVDQKWVRRPLVLSPAVCARFGWKCLNYNLLECVTCGAKLCSPEPKIDLPDVYKACIEKILKELKSSHKTHCPWPLTPSPESFVKMFSVPKEEALKFFLQRLEPSLESSSALPQIKSSAITQLGLNEQHISAFCKLVKVNEDTQKFGTCAVSLAASGWTITTKGEKEKKTFVECRSCQRSIWTGSFNLLSASNVENTSGETSHNGNTSIEDSPSFRTKRFKKDDFDPLEEHRPWCLWIGTENKKSFNGKGDCADVEKDLESSKIPGWKIFMKSLLRNICESDDVRWEINPTKEQIRSVRDLLETWTDPIE